MGDTKALMSNRVFCCYLFQLGGRLAGHKRVSGNVCSIDILESEHDLWKSGTSLAELGKGSTEE